MKSLQTVPFDSAFINEPVGKSKISERDYKPAGRYPIVDQGRRLIAGYTDASEFVREGAPRIVFGDHTRIIKFADFPFVVGADGVRLFQAAPGFLPEFLFFFLRASQLPEDIYGRHSKYLAALSVPVLPDSEQLAICTATKVHLSLVDEVRVALAKQMSNISSLANAAISETVSNAGGNSIKLREALDEVTVGIGSSWKSHRTLGATRNGLALARERPGKHPERYKPVTAGTVFYNPMRILIGSIAFVDDDDEPGITSPDYVVLKGKPGVVDSRWFYYWLRSPLGERCIQSLARGAVRERMLFNRLAEGEIKLPSYDAQVKASNALAQIKPMRAAIQKQIEEIDLLPRKLLAEVFGS